MDMSELSGYCRAADEARRLYPRLRILKGMECEYDEKYAAYYQDELLGRLNFDYLIGSVHFFPCREGWRDAFWEIKDGNDLRLYARHFIATMQSGLFAFMAHPDLFATGYLKWDSQSKECSAEMFEAAASLDMPLEINAGGLRKPPVATPEGERPAFPLTPFWEMAAEYGIRVIINSDAHRPSDIAGKTDEAFVLATRCGLAFAEI
jgi:histidinol-phosphatase (PHP family)